MLGYLFLSPIPNPWFESLFAAYSQSTFIGLPPTKNKELPSSGVWVRTNTERAHQTTKKQQKFLSCDYVFCKASHRVVSRRSYERKQMYQNVWCNIEKFLFCLTTSPFDVKVTVLVA